MTSRRKYTQLLAKRGMPVTIPAAPAIKRVRLLHDVYHMTFKQMHEISGISQQTLHNWYKGRGSRTPTGKPLMAHRDNVQAVLGIPVPTEPVRPAAGHRGAALPRCGAVRRLDALALQGWPVRWLGRQYAENHDCFWEVYRHDLFVMASTHQLVTRIYDELKDKTPDDFGISRDAQVNAILGAKRREAVPAHCWDEDTIDDPRAFPEWTGLCGTVEGYWIHKREGHRFIKREGNHIREVIGCDACRRARSEQKRVSSS